MRAGYYADLAVFDPATVGDAATFERPVAAARGIRHVLVNGTLTYSDGEATTQRAGRFLSARRG